MSDAREAVENFASAVEVLATRIRKGECMGLAVIGYFTGDQRPTEFYISSPGLMESVMIGAIYRVLAQIANNQIASDIANRMAESGISSNGYPPSTEDGHDHGNDDDAVAKAPTPPAPNVEELDNPLLPKRRVH